METQTLYLIKYNPGGGRGEEGNDEMMILHHATVFKVLQYYKNN